jgi:GTP-binding protein
VANKADNYNQHAESAEFYSLGLGDPFCISAINGSYTGDLLDKILADLPEELPEILEEDLPRIAVVGRPNAGKSSLVNALIGEDRNIVTNIAGTTRDSIYTKFNKFEKNFYLVDTAGIRKKGKIDEDLEYYSVIRSIRAIENSDVCVLMIDATRGIEGQDLNIFSLIQKNKKGLVVCVNKWDLVENKNQKVIDSYTSAIKDRLAPFTDFPILFISALTKQRLLKVLDAAEEVYNNRKKRIPTGKLNEVLLPIIENYPPPAWKGKYIKIKYITQLPAGAIPSFVFFCNLPQWIKDPYKRFLENKIRENWDFTGTPINIFIREK